MVITDVTVPLEVDVTFIADVPTQVTCFIKSFLTKFQEILVRSPVIPEAVVVMLLSLEVSVRSAEL